MEKKKIDDLTIVLIDMQDHYIDCEEKRLIVPNQITVLNTFRTIPLVVIEYNGEGETTSVLKDEIKKVSNVRTFLKAQNDAFTNPQLGSWLRHLSKKNLLLMGVNACGCVYDTATSALCEGYSLITSQDLIAGYCKAHTKSGTRQRWYRANSLFFDNHIALIQSLV